MFRVGIPKTVSSPELARWKNIRPSPSSEEKPDSPKKEPASKSNELDPDTRTL